MVCLRYLGLDDGAKPGFESTRPSWKHLHQPKQAGISVQHSNRVTEDEKERKTDPVESGQGPQVLVKRTGEESFNGNADSVTSEMCSKRTKIDKTVVSEECRKLTESSEGLDIGKSNTVNSDS